MKLTLFLTAMFCLVMFALGAARHTAHAQQTPPDLVMLRDQWAVKERQIDAKLKEVQACLDVLSGKRDLPAAVKETVGQRMAGRYARFVGDLKIEEIELRPDYTWHTVGAAEANSWCITSEGLRLRWTDKRWMLLKPGPLAGIYEGSETRDGKTQPGALHLITKEVGK
jgi:hypothetical protein